MKARNRIKPLLTLCCALLLVAAGVFGTLAYLTGTDTVNNTFTVGNVKITLEHVTEGHLIVDELKDEPVPMAVGPSLTHASKFELRNKTFETPGILANAGCQVSIITDSPVIPQQYLPLCAGLAIKSGMKEWDALKAITINAAKHIGIEDRVGSLEIGKDADILVMEGSCFEVSAQPEIVIIDGKVVA